ncbi:MAG: methionine--tRNA ligase [Chlamydiales bacterium]
MKKILITSALPYANGPLHFGHIAGAYLPADCYARFERLRGNDVLYICGSDEYGVAITLSAEIARQTPKEHVDHFHQVIKNFFDKLWIDFDYFSRTTSPTHIPIVQDFFHDLKANGYIEAIETEQLYSEIDKRFLADRYVIGTCPRCGFEEARGDECMKCGASYETSDLKKPRSKITGKSLGWKKTTHWFMRFDRFKEQLASFISNRSWKANVVHFAQAYLDDLRPRAITRDLEWGIPVPLKEAVGKVFYVWFDAPIGYISATQDWAKERGNPEAWKSYWCDPQTKYVQFIGKDNIPFHAIFFPAMILGQNSPYKLVDDLVANEFYNFEGRQFSKSEGWVIDIEDFFSYFHSDQIRYVIAANAPETSDTEFTWRDFQTRCNSELLGKLGNLVNRVLIFVQNHCNRRIPQYERMQDIDHRFLEKINELTDDIEHAYAAYKMRRASQLIMELAQIGNTYFDAKTPWKDIKDQKYSSLQTTIGLSFVLLKALALTSFPIMPQTGEKIWKMIGFQKPLELYSWKTVIEMSCEIGKVLPVPSLLFQKVEDEIIEMQINKIRDVKKKCI